MSQTVLVYYLVYEVKGFEGEHRAGPYREADVDYQKDDICGFEGVKFLRTECEPLVVPGIL